MYNYSQLFVGGEWRTPAGSGSIAVFSPSDETLIGNVPEAVQSDVDEAVARARRAFDESSDEDWDAQSRATTLRAIAQRLEANADELARIVSLESGIPWAFTRPGIGSCVERCLFYADLATRFSFEQPRTGARHRLLIRHEPVGVLAAIVPWNAPLNLAITKLAPAIAAGCPVVLKPAPETPLSALFLARICEEAGLPKGMLSVLPAGAETSEALVAHPGVDMVSFTGSTAVGRRIGSVCGGLIRRSTLELGGKSAAILLEDVDIPAVLSRLIVSTMMNNGQACVLQSRVLVPESRHDEISAELAAAIGKLRIGPALDPDTFIGPLATEMQRARVEEYIALGRTEGARIRVGGGRPPGLNRGWFVEPTLFDGVSPEMRIAREEIFGPVVALIPYRTVEDAIEIANDSEYGLSGTVWTTDIDRALAVARQIRTGNFGINLFGMDVRAPFGGYKSSGMGRELGEEGFLDLLEQKAIHLAPNS